MCTDFEFLNSKSLKSPSFERGLFESIIILLNTQTNLPLAEAIKIKPVVDLINLTNHMFL